MKNFVCVLALMIGLSAYAGFGGARSGGFSGGFRGSSSFSSGRSSFGGYRSSGAPATISRPSYSSSYSRGMSTGTVRNNTTIIHSGDGGFWNGLFLGSMMSRPAVYDANGVIVQPAVAASHPILDFVFALIIIGVIVAIVWAVVCG